MRAVPALRQGEIVAGSVALTAAALAGISVVTACVIRDEHGVLAVIIWQPLAAVRFGRCSDADAGAITGVICGRCQPIIAGTSVCDRLAKTERFVARSRKALTSAVFTSFAWCAFAFELNDTLTVRAADARRADVTRENAKRALSNLLITCGDRTVFIRCRAEGNAGDIRLAISYATPRVVAARAGRRVVEIVADCAFIDELAAELRVTNACGALVDFADAEVAPLARTIPAGGAERADVVIFALLPVARFAVPFAQPVFGVAGSDCTDVPIVAVAERRRSSKTAIGVRRIVVGCAALFTIAVQPVVAT